MLSKHKKSLNPLIQIVSKPFLGLNPSLLTVIGLIFPVLFFIFLQKGNFVTALIVLMGSAFDAIDGAVARNTNKVTPFGGVLDSTLDRLSDAIYISTFGFAGYVRWSLVIAVLITSYLVSYIRSRAELAGKGKFKLDIGLIERSERIILIGIATLLLFFHAQNHFLGINPPEFVFIIILLLSAYTVFQRFEVSYKRLGGKRR